MNQRVDATAQFLSAAVWSPCGEPIDLDGLKDRRCYACFDLSAARYLTASVLVFAKDDDQLDVLPFSGCRTTTSASAKTPTACRTSVGATRATC